MKINQQYIANELSVSRVTVTKALQDHPDIATATKEKIKDLADRLGYIPNGIGRSLSTQRTHTIGLVVPKIDHSFFSSIIEKIYRKAAELGYQIILMVSFEDEDTEYHHVKTLLSMNVDGILIDTASTSTSGRTFALVEQHGKPLLSFDRQPRGVSKPGVFFADHRLTYDCTRALLSRGYTRLMYMTGPRQLNICYDRLEGFRAALREAGLLLPPRWVVETELDRKAAKRDFRDYLESKVELPEAVLCVTDSVALGVYAACAEAGLIIPDDLGVVGFGNVRSAELVQPPLSTIDLKLRTAGELAVSRLVEMITTTNSSRRATPGGPNTAPPEPVGGRVILRQSVKERI